MDEVTLRRQKEIFLTTYLHSANAVTPMDIALESAINTSVRHNPTYSDGVLKEQKRLIIAFWHNELIQRGAKYLNQTQTLNTYIDDVIGMKANINSRFSGLLNNHISSGIRIAHCQKSLSVYLKYMWCQNIATVAPPFCPIDRIVLSRCGLPNVLWTHIDDEASLRLIVSGVSNHVNNHFCCGSIAEWELCMFNL